MIRYSGTEFTTDKKIIFKLKRFEMALNKAGIITKTVFIKILSSGKRVEKEIDVKIATDMVAYGFKNCYDTAVLISGDGDFKPAIEWLKQLNKKIEIWTFKKSLSRRLEAIVDKNNIFYIDDYLNEIERV